MAPGRQDRADGFLRIRGITQQCQHARSVIERVKETGSGDFLHVDDVIPVVATGTLDGIGHGHATVAEEDYDLDYFGVGQGFLNGSEVLVAAPKHAGVVCKLKLDVQDSAVCEPGDDVGDHFGAGWKFDGEKLGDRSVGYTAE